MEDSEFEEIFKQTTIVSNPFNDKAFIASLQGVLRDKVFTKLIDPRDGTKGDYIRVTVVMDLKCADE